MGSILLVDDEPLQAFARKSALEHRFHDVQRVADAADALCLVEQLKVAGGLALVIAGHHSAGFGGPEFVAELLVRRPDLKVIVIGGDSESARDYPGANVHFVPNRTSIAELTDLAGILMKECHRTAA